MAVWQSHQAPPHLVTRRSAPAVGHLLNLPNILTLCRLGSIPIFLSFLSKHRYTPALYVFIAAAITDSLDGTVARWFDSRTEIGAFLDPFADKLMLVSAFVVMTIEGDFPGWLLSVVAIRDIVIVFGYLMLSFFTGERIPVRPSYLGKSSTFLQLACVTGALLRMRLAYPAYWYPLLYATVAVTAMSGVHYMYRGLVWLGSREPEMFV
ncbi:MAG TPA: CDP-alcohol phosphatidyltransferase family protein [Candidatus Binataceae bacterium]|nr:CDP-alcohol phosphatidyltransferase family protein [Candidatus Binataceae bacterium]